MLSMVRFITSKGTLGHTEGFHRLPGKQKHFSHPIILLQLLIIEMHRTGHNVFIHRLLQPAIENSWCSKGTLWKIHQKVHFFSIF